jgi:RNA-directed DNA polymerase
MGYYGAFFISNLYPVLRRINTYLLRWVMSKYKNRSTWKKATRTLTEAAERRPRYFRALGLGETGRQMTRTAGAV